MKKLLLGALLVVGATSFGAVLTEDAGGTTYSGSETLMLRASGNIVDVTTTPTLVVEPTGTATGGGAIDFIFGSMVMDGQPKYATGAFTAKVIKDDGQKDVLVPIETTEIDAKLAGGTVDGSGKLTNIKLVDTGTGTSIGDLVYTLAFAPNTDKTIYTGTITAEVTPTAVGTFLNREGSVDVIVTNLNPTN